MKKDFLERIYKKILEKITEEEPKEKKEPEKIVKCYICDKKHGLKCDKFARMSRMERFEVVKSQALCFNCLKPGHIAEEYRKPVCKCGERKHFQMKISF